eukprot:TRINITY_DN7654_c0_g1_i1.p1 TRINITY_DN7654_c0_g1~~TRINITY_DN7654_c0_g1_i1.p1  ORF type:complete len:528 (-),score=100.26 TRINITY_DN7654_c0_g1_i1:50-1570(-)
MNGSPPLIDAGSVLLTRPSSVGPSSLFASIGYLLEDGARQLPRSVRQHLAKHIVAHKHLYNSDTLPLPLQQYCVGLMKESFTPGEFELKLVCECYGVEICVVSAVDGNLTMFGDTMGYTRRIYLVSHAGEHYQPVVANVSLQSPHSRDQRVFSPNDPNAFFQVLTQLVDSSVSSSRGSSPRGHSPSKANQSDPVYQIATHSCPLDSSVIHVSHEDVCFKEGDTVLVEATKSTLATVLLHPDLPAHTVSLSPQLAQNSGANNQSHLLLFKADELQYGSAVTIHYRSAEQLTDEIIYPALLDYFQQHFRPVTTGDAFTIMWGDIEITVEIKSIKPDSLKHCLIGEDTNIWLLSDKKRPVSRANSSSASSHSASSLGRIGKSIFQDAMQGSLLGEAKSNVEDPDLEHWNYEQILEWEQRHGAVSRGLTRTQLSVLPLVRYSANMAASLPPHQHTDNQPTCQICFSEFEEGEFTRPNLLFCPHSYHQECIDRWLQQNPTCPVCRAEIRPS